MDTRRKKGAPKPLLLAGFVLLFALLFLAAEKALFDETHIQKTWAYATSEEAEPIDVLFVGNSHTYRAVDAGAVSQALDINARILSCTSSNAGINVASLEAFLNYSVPGVVVMEFCPFCVNNYGSMKEQKRGFVLQHMDGIPNYGIKLKALRQTLYPEDVPAGMFQLLRPTQMWTRWDRSAKASASDDYGFAPVACKAPLQDYSAATQDEFYGQAPASGERGTLFSENEKALEALMALSEKYGFALWFFAVPVAECIESYRSASWVLQDIAGEGSAITYFDNFWCSQAALGLDQSDWYDAGHLSRTGAEKLTAHYIDLLAERLAP